MPLQIFLQTTPPPPPVIPAEPEAILIVRLSARGDVMFATPIIRALRNRYPEAHLTWVVEPAASDVVLHHPELDEVVVWDRGEWKRLIRKGRFREVWRRLRDFRHTLRARRYDLAIDMQGLLRSGAVTRLSGAPVRVGLGSKEGSSILMTHRYPTGIEVAHMSGEPRLMADWLGLDVTDFSLDLHLEPHLHRGAEEALAEAGVAGPFILLVPFTTRPWKHWIESRWAELARDMHRDFRIPVVLVGGPADRDAADRVLAQAGGALVDLVGKTSLGEAVAVVSRASLVVGVDTALTHAAHAFVRPTICVFGPAGYIEPPTPVARMVRHWLACVPCHTLGKPVTCGNDYTCMKLITPREIMEHARELLQAAPAQN
jgi:heptosyltransferase-1